MKTKIHAAILFAAIVTVVSCKWFAHKNELENKSGLLAGRYEVAGIKDSSTQHKLKPIDTLTWFFNSPLKDSSERYLNFSSDSLVTYETETKVDSSKFYTDTVTKIVYLKNDSSYQPLNILRQSDSSIDLFAANDSVYISLKKL